jgi:hypothetical protein
MIRLDCSCVDMNYIISFFIGWEKAILNALRAFWLCTPLSCQIVPQGILLDKTKFYGVDC